MIGSEKAKFEVQRFMASDGIFAESLGKLYITEKSWHVVTYIDLQTFENNFNFAKSTFDKMINMCKNDKLFSYIENEQNIILRRKFSEIEQQKLEIFQMLQSKESTRRKRAVGPLVYVGKIGKFLFGILNEDDKRFFDEKINLLDESSKDALSLLENQTRIVKNKFLMCEENFKHYDKIIKEHEIFINNQTVNIRKIAFYVSIIHRYITDLEIDCESLTNAIVFAHEGQLHPKLISHDNIINLIRVIQLSEPDFDIPFSSNNPILGEISKISKITIYYENFRINYVIDIPLLGKESFTLYKYYPVPNPILNSNLFTFISPNSKYAAIDSDRDTFVNLNDWQLSECDKCSKGYICENVPIFTNNKYNPCEIKILLHQKVEIHDNCDIRVKALKQPLFQKIIKLNSWLYSSPTNTILKIICNDQIYEEILLGSGLITLEPNCKAKTDLVILKPSKVKKFFQINKPLNAFYNFSDFTHTIDIFKQINITNFLEQRDHLNYEDRDLEKSDHLTDVLDTIKAIKSEKKN